MLVKVALFLTTKYLCMRLAIISTISFMILLLIACSDETALGPSVFEDSNKLDSRGVAQEIDISYDVTETHSFEPTEGTIEEMCLMDLKVFTVPPTTKSVTSTIDGEGNFCGSIEGYNNSTREGGEGSRPDYTVSFCNGQVTYADDSGTSTVDITIDPGFLIAVTQSFGLSNEDKGRLFNQMIAEAQSKGAEVVDNGNSVTITTVNDDGSTTSVVYDKTAMAIVSSTTKDSSGEVTSKTIIVYTCNNDGTVIPKQVVEINLETATVCSPPIITKDVLTFNNFQVNVN